MNEIVDFLKSNFDKKVIDEDGDCLSIELKDGISEDDFQEYENIHRIALPKDLKNLLLFSNGIKIYGIEIYPLLEMNFSEEQMLLVFHSWGNGDFDCISLRQDSNYGKIYFANHSIEHLVSMEILLGEWMYLMVKEIQQKGTLLHPIDYSIRNEDGLYKEVFLKLNKQK